MKKMTFLAVLAVSSVSLAGEDKQLLKLAYGNAAPDVVAKPEKVAPTPYAAAQPPAQGEARSVQQRSKEESLRHVNFELHIQNAKLVTEAAANKKTIEEQNQSLINLANQAGALGGELRSTAAALAAEKAMRLAEKKKNDELKQELADGNSRLFNELLAVLVLLAAFVAAIMVLVIMAARNTAAVMKRIPNEAEREYVDEVGAEFEAQREAFELAMAAMRNALREEKERADHLSETAEGLKKRNTENVSAMMRLLDEVSRDFSGMLNEEKRKYMLLQLRLAEAVEIAEFRGFEIDGLKKRRLPDLDKERTSDQQVVAADAPSPQDDFGINPDEGAVETPPDLVAAPGAEPARGTTAMAVVEDAEEERRLADRILETRGDLLPAGEAVTHGGSEPKA